MISPSVMSDLISAAMRWRISWADAEDLQEAAQGCNCEVCQLIRACDALSLDIVTESNEIRARQNDGR